MIFLQKEKEKKGKGIIKALVGAETESLRKQISGSGKRLNKQKI